MNLRNEADLILDDAFRKHLLNVFGRYFERMDQGATPLLNDLKKALIAHQDATKALEEL
jgi:hypothetical protein